MATMTKTTKPDAATLMREAEVELAAARAEHAELQQRAHGEVARWVTRREDHAYVTATGQAAHAMVDTRVLETEHVGPLERLRARRALADAQDRVALAEEQLEAARAGAREQGRAERGQAIERGAQVLRAELPGLIRELRAAQQRMQVFAERTAALDQPLGGVRHFAEAVFVPFLPGRELDFWVEHVRAMFGLPE